MSVADIGVRVRFVGPMHPPNIVNNIFYIECPSGPMSKTRENDRVCAENSGSAVRTKIRLRKQTVKGHGKGFSSSD